MIFGDPINEIEGGGRERNREDREGEIYNEHNIVVDFNILRMRKGVS